MRKFLVLLVAVMMCLTAIGCGAEAKTPLIAATTLPVYEFTAYLCQETDLTVSPLITESVSCLHDYSLQVKQMRTIESADLVIISGAGLEEFLDDALNSAKSVLDASANIDLLSNEESHDYKLESLEQSHNADPHIWLSPVNAKTMSHNICQGLIVAYPEYADFFSKNLASLDKKFDALIQYADDELSALSCRELITFHDGFSYMAEAFDLTILHAIEEESGSEASAAELIELIQMVSSHDIPAIFTEKNSSGSAASVIAAETGTAVYVLDMALSGDSYFTAMYHNIDTLKEALK